METRQTGVGGWGDGGSSSEQQLPGVSVLTLWTPACHCRCETKHRTAAGPHTSPAAALPAARLATGPGGVVTGDPQSLDKGCARVRGSGGCSPEPSAPAWAGSGETSPGAGLPPGRGLDKQVCTPGKSRATKPPGEGVMLRLWAARGPHQERMGAPVVAAVGP